MKTFTLILTEQQLNTVASALGDMPFRLSAPVIQAIQTQVEQQQKKMPSTGEDTPE